MLKATIVTFLFCVLCTSTYANRGKHKEIRKAACQGKQVGESCSFDGRKGQVSGTCVEGRKDSSVILCHDPNAKPRMKKNRQ